MTDERAGELRKLIRKDFQRQAAAMGSVFQELARSQGFVANALIAAGDVREFEPPAGITLYAAVSLRKAGAAVPLKEIFVRVVYVPELGTAFAQINGVPTTIGESPGDTGADGGRKGYEAITQDHDLSNWHSKAGAYLEGFLAGLPAEQLEDLEVSVQSAPGSLEPKVVVLPAHADDLFTFYSADHLRYLMQGLAP